MSKNNISHSKNIERFRQLQEQRRAKAHSRQAKRILFKNNTLSPVRDDRE